MILHGNQRGGAYDLAQHLMKQENERVEIHELRGFASDNLFEAFQESYAISRATRCKQHLYSLSLNPPLSAEVSTEDFEAAIDTVEERLNLKGQSRAIVFHEKRGGDGILRRHAHAVWCRIEPVEMKAVHLPFTKLTLQDISRELYIEHNWKMPRGFVSIHERDPRNFSLDEWQQAKRAGKDPKKLKTLFQERWAISDGKASFAHALEEQGYILAKGDRRGFVAVDHQGDVYAISKWVGIKAKQVRARLGELDDLPSVQEAHDKAAQMVAERLETLRQEQQVKTEHKLECIERKRQRSQEIQRTEQKNLSQKQAKQQEIELARQRARFRKGLFGLLDRFTGKRKRTEKQNQIETEQTLLENQTKQNALNSQHEAVQKTIQKTATIQKAWQKAVDDDLKQDIAWLQAPVALDQEAEEQSRKHIKRRHQRTRDGP